METFHFDFEGPEDPAEFVGAYTEVLHPALVDEQVAATPWSVAGESGLYVVTGCSAGVPAATMAGFANFHGFRIRRQRVLSSLFFPRPPEAKVPFGCMVPYNFEPAGLAELSRRCPEGHLFKDHGLENCPVCGGALTSI